MSSSNNKSKAVFKRRNPNKRLKRQLNGGKYSPAQNPPDVTAQPWYPLSLSWTGRPANVTFDVVVAYFKHQLDPNGNGLNSASFDSNSGTPFRVQFRFLSVAVWNLTGRAISLTVWDDLEKDNTTKDQLGGWTDCGGLATFPRIGYVYPISHQARVHRPDPDLKSTIVFNTTASSSSDTILHNLHLLWRFDGSVKVLSVLPSLEEKILTEIQNVASSIHASQPSTLDKVIDGAKVAASVVSVVAASGFADRVGAADVESIALRVVAHLRQACSPSRASHHASSSAGSDIDYIIDRFSECDPAALRND